MPMPPIRIAFQAVFWRVFLVTFAIQQFTAFHKTRHMLRLAGPAQKFEAFLDFTPYALTLGLLVAALVTVGLDLAVRFTLAPVLAHWYRPRGTGAHTTSVDFHAMPGEVILLQEPARRADLHGWRAGTLVLTTSTLAYYPRDWDREPWSAARAELQDVRIEPSRAMLGSFLVGVPGRLCIQAKDGRELTLALANPEEIYQPLAHHAPASKGQARHV